MSKLLLQARHLVATGDYADAEALCRHLLTAGGPVGAVRQVLVECLYNQGMMLLQGGMFDDAEERFRSAVEVNPKYALALNNLGSIRLLQGRHAEALSYFQQAFRADPRCLEAARNLATGLQNLDRLDEAAAMFERLAKLDPKNAGLYLLRNATLVRGIIPDAAYPDQVRSRMHRMLDQCLASPLRATRPESFTAPYFFLSYHGKPNRELHARIAQAYLHVCPQLGWTASQLADAAGRQGRIRVGILSAHLANHSIGGTTCGLVEQLDRDRFEVIVIRLGRSPGDAMARRIDAAASSVLTLGTHDLAAARECIAELALDVLFYQDIGMEPFAYLLSFARLAPVQLTSLGHPDTTGVPNMDYFLSSDLYEPEGAAAHYSERLLTIPNAGTLSYYDRPTPPAGPVPRSEFGLDEGESVYLCPQTLFKVHPDMDAVLAGIVRRDSRARIVFIEPAKAHYRQELEARWRTLPHGTPERITFIKRLEHEKYLRLLACADVMLDTVHFNGQNTNLEAFSVGVPVVTWPGAMQRGRHTLGMYRKMGEQLFADLVAADAEDYADKAVRLATCPEHRRELVSRIEANRDKLYQDSEFVRSCERLFTGLVKR